ncbi:MAG: aspartate-semialdehyde dehydrogenase, partial [Sphingomonadales bacterium]|nr:aspartate-semialdehyde dehydrogenase [Sphingomonadales bacterium]
VETKKILDSGIEVCASCVRVPVFVGHAEMINVEFKKPITHDEARDVLREAPGVSVVDHRVEEGYVTPAECAGEDAVFVSRIRNDASVKNGLNFWCVSDNLRKGAALNTVQIAEILASDYLDK